MRPSVRASRSPAAAPPAGDDLGGDADGGLLGGAGTEVEADRAGEPGRARRRSRPASRSRSSRSSWVRREPIAPTYATSGSRSATSSSGTSNFGSWVSTQSTVRGSIRPASASARDSGAASRRPPRRPPGNGWRGEDRPGVADRDLVAEELADPGHRRREVDRAEDQHPRLRGERPDEHPHPLAAALAVGAVGQRRVVPGGQQPDARRRGRRRPPRRAERAAVAGRSGRTTSGARAKRGRGAR